VHGGRLTRGQLRSSAWRQLFPDVYACASVPVDHRLRARAVVRLLLPDAVLSGRSAAVVWGVDLAGPEDDVECTVPVTYRAGTARGVRVTRRALPPEDVVTRGGVRITTQLRTALDLARIRPVEGAVVALDQFVRLRRMSLADLTAAAARLTGPGCRRVREAVGKADGLAQSPQETRLRLRLHASRLPRPVAQYEVRDARGFVARVDFAWPEARVAVEYDGWWHGQPQNVPKDRRRLNRLTAAGWTVIFATADDIDDPVQLVARIGAALAAGAVRR
jgi:very-short-patch-repair endonuclease